MYFLNAAYLSKVIKKKAKGKQIATFTLIK